MEFSGEIRIRNADQVRRNLGLNVGGRVQKYIDSECIRLMAPYTPFESGGLERSAKAPNTTIGSGIIKQKAPQGRYLYYGKLMVSSLTGSAWASRGESKVLTEKDLKYSKANHPLAGSFWFKRMVSDKKDQILRGAQQEANRGAE